MREYDASHGKKAASDLANLTGIIFRANALSRVFAKYSTRADEFRAALQAASDAALEAALETADIAAGFAVGAAHSAAEAAAGAVSAAHSAAEAAGAYPADAADPVGADYPASIVWRAIRSDIDSILSRGAEPTSDLPLWPSGAPERASNAWTRLCAVLPGDQDWEVWFDWYEERLRGGSRGEDYEFVFASVPQEEWDKGPAAANAWIKAQLRGSEANLPRERIHFHDRNSFEKWLEGQEPNVPVLLATRAALRVLPASVRTGGTPGYEALAEKVLRGEAFRAVALARVSAMWPTNSRALQAALDAAAAPAAMRPLSPAGVAADAADAARLRVTRSAVRASAARAAENAALILASEAGPDASRAAWEECRFDARRLTLGAAGLSNCPIWSAAGRGQFWEDGAWPVLRTTLPKNEDWDVWIDWYDDRLRGGSRGEAYELVFASVPQEEWEKGPAVANAWIKAHLPQIVTEPGRRELPVPLENVPSVNTYAVNAAGRIAVVAGPQNVPLFPFSTSAEDHRAWLEAARTLARRLIDDIHAHKFGNFPVERYREYIERYELDLPSEPGAGNFVIADFEARALRTLFADEAQIIPSVFSSRLKAFLEAHFALRPFYPTVARMYEAINTGRLQEPPPFEEFERFSRTVAENSERFEPDVLEGLEQISQAEAAAPAEPEFGAATGQYIEPPPDPLTEPDPFKERAFSMAGATNNIVAAARRGAEMGRTLDGWDKFLHTIHDAGAVAIEWLHHFSSTL